MPGIYLNQSVIKVVKFTQTFAPIIQSSDYTLIDLINLKLWGRLITLLLPLLLLLLKLLKNTYIFSLHSRTLSFLTQTKHLLIICLYTKLSTINLSCIPSVMGQWVIGSSFMFQRAGEINSLGFTTNKKAFIRGGEGMDNQQWPQCCIIKHNYAPVM